ncbi:hypothetical protein BK142_31805 [Paenibacillus glucanolyticus]|nr:hypothetical protein BK142_31805 [Paenibacillus glucanolyticus]
MFSLWVWLLEQFRLLYMRHKHLALRKHMALSSVTVIKIKAKFNIIMATLKLEVMHMLLILQVPVFQLAIWVQRLNSTTMVVCVPRMIGTIMKHQAQVL